MQVQHIYLAYAANYCSDEDILNKKERKSHKIS